MLKCWSDFPGYHDFVKDQWQSFQVSGWGGYVLKEKLKMMKNSPKEWHLNHGRNTTGRLNEVKDRMNVLDIKGEDEDLSDADREKLRSLRRHNALVNLNVNGVQVEGVIGVREVVFNHFEHHFRSVRVPRPDIGNLQFQSISEDDAYLLERPFSEEEVKQAVWDCESFKSPGPDGVNFGFIKEFWPHIKGDFMQFMLEFYTNGRLVKGSNCTFIVLISKFDNPQKVSYFRPIYLVGCMYKVLAKVLANRLKLIIGKVISESQSAFVKGRQILDGILIANELVDDAKKQKKELILFKVDFEKAYDSVEWSYLDAVMDKMGFKCKWRQWIMSYISTATASVLVNGSPIKEFSIGRGLRQGDPLSPFLFLIAAEGLNVILKASVDSGLFKGYQIGSDPLSRVSVSHLQFADDTLIIG
ncbi:cysteine-rich receptor-like protein kinase [Trifolium medium]|uniref:Cysteine-rich receptor-like protein kinase n=1 Tax=Trifolium medium TaxID=97028 RepID=A0A392MH18_9FABA|nr:cysteine-rich receptor-like protein kinase [Trifolium medium]